MAEVGGGREIYGRDGTEKNCEMWKVSLDRKITGGIANTNEV